MAITMDENFMHPGEVLNGAEYAQREKEGPRSVVVTADTPEDCRRLKAFMTHSGLLTKRTDDGLAVPIEYMFQNG